MPETPSAPRHSLKRSRRPTLLLVLVAAALAAGAAWLWLGRAPQPAPAAAPGAAAAPSPDPGMPAAGGPVAPPSPADVRALLEAVSPHPAYRRWLGMGDLVDRWAAVTENLATGASPRAHLAFLEPAAPFSAATRGGRAVIAAASYARYDPFADAVASLDGHAAARAYRALRPAIDAAFRTFAPPGLSLEAATARALQRLAAAPVVDGDVPVVDEGGVYLFDDPALERLGEVEKHLLRMGPRNTRLVQQKAREILEALGLPAPTAERR